MTGLGTKASRFTSGNTGLDLVVSSLGLLQLLNALVVDGLVTELNQPLPSRERSSLPARLGTPTSSLHRLRAMQEKNLSGTSGRLGSFCGQKRRALQYLCG
mmetsp:Transcript_902/g.2872  ORF Transcript_902/g.2872 Transcript_902/m.2872 type:complete len:101 (-) Transcript_902:85-387(-)